MVFRTVMSSKLWRNLQQTRNFVNARIKWVRDPYLDEVVEHEKNLKQLITLKNQVISSPSKSLPLSLLKPLTNHPITTTTFVQKHNSIFTIYQPSPSLPLHVRLTPQALTLHNEELDIHISRTHRKFTAHRLAKLLMLTREGSLPVDLIDRFRFDLGLPHDYVTSFIGEFPDYFRVIEVKDKLTGYNTFALSVSWWRNNFAVSELEKLQSPINAHIRYSMNFPKGFDLEKRVKNWVEEWQNLPYISPYENAFHLGPNSDQAEKWTVAVLHEVLSLLVSKKTEMSNLLCLGEYLGFGIRFKKALVHNPGIFYMSHKLRTQTVVLREAYQKGFLVEKHPLMGMRHRYVYLMSLSKRFKKQNYSVHDNQRF